MTKLILIAAALLGAATSPGIAREARPAALPDTRPSATARAENPAQVYCVIEEHTGSRIRHKICKTLAAWRDEGFDPLAKD